MERLRSDLPELVKTHTEAKIKENLTEIGSQLEELRKLFTGIDKNVVELITWKAKGQVVHRDDLLAAIWAASFCGLTNSDHNNCFERLVTHCFWVRNAFSSSARKEMSSFILSYTRERNRNGGR